MDRNEIINGCIKVESAAASIYSKFMHLFPENQDFWEGLYNDEKEHISFLSDVKSLDLSDEVRKMNLLPSKSKIKEVLKLSVYASLYLPKRMSGSSGSPLLLLKILSKNPIAAQDKYSVHAD